MRLFFYSFFAMVLLSGCKKGNGSRIDIYLLKSFKTVVDQTTVPAITSITDAVLEDVPFVADNDIASYSRSTCSFALRKNIGTIIKDYGPDKAFALTLDNKPVYFGKFHPAYMSSIILGVATIDPILNTDKQLRIDFVSITGSTSLTQFDKRNDSKIINSLSQTNRLR